MRAGYFVMFLSFASIGHAFDLSKFSQESPRLEIAPAFSQKDGTLVLEAPDREGIQGFWQTQQVVSGGETYRFSIKRRIENISHPRRSCSVRIEWSDAQGNPVASDEAINPAYFGTADEVTPRAAPDFPRDKKQLDEKWTLVEERLTAPSQAQIATIQLHLRWAPGGKVIWDDFQFEKSDPLPPRWVTLSAVHHNLAGNGRSREENWAILTPLIEKAAAAEADLIVLPELLTCKGVSRNYIEMAETIPGPTTQYFAKLAKEYDCYIVIGLPERDEHLVYNVAVLVGPEGNIVGKYRKVTLPREEIQQGIAPGHEYPVFPTRFGKVGMMICYDVFFPEVARSLAMNGAEIIALPIWGGNPRLAAARCAENGIYLVSSTYTDHRKNWMKTAIWNREGDRIEEASEWATVVTAKVDLNKRTYWNGLGDFQSRIAREAPVRHAE